MVLDAILAAKRVEVAARSAARPLDRIRDGLTPSDRDFERALGRRRPAFVLELKPASPSAGRLRAEADLDPVIGAYRPHADAISVLTDRTHFGGSFELLRRVRSRVTQPVLCKDFVVDPYQVYEARSHGADAVLLMLQVLDDPTYRAAAAAAAELGMGVLTEVHSEAELRRAAMLGARVIGINNRNLATLKVDLETTPRLARLAPPGTTVIAESGIGSHEDVRRLRSVVDGFLVGTALMRASDPSRAARRLIFGPTKVCGLTRPADAAAAAALGATHGGVIFAAESPRAVHPDRARVLASVAELDWVGVFADDDPDRIVRLVDRLCLSAVQLHGGEPPEYLARLRRSLPPYCAIWRAARIDGPASIPEPHAAELVLLDTFVPDQRGGTGIAFDWSWLHPIRDPMRYVLSGGLNPDNVARANRTPIGFLDVSSGVESAPGVKDPDRLARFFEARRASPASRP